MKFEDINKKILDSIHVYPVRKFLFVKKSFEQGYFYILKSFTSKVYQCTDKPDDEERIIEKVILKKFENTPIDVFVKMGFKEESITLKKYLFLQAYINGECKDWNEFLPCEELEERIESNRNIELLNRIKKKDDKIKTLYEYNRRIEQENKELKQKIHELEKVKKQVLELKIMLDKINI